MIVDSQRGEGGHQSFARKLEQKSQVSGKREMTILTMNIDCDPPHKLILIHYGDGQKGVGQAGGNRCTVVFTENDTLDLVE